VTWRLARHTRDAVKQAGEQITISKSELAILEKQAAALDEEAKAMREQTEATKRQAELSAAALEGSARPILVGVPIGLEPEREPVFYSAEYQTAVGRSRVHYEETEDHVYFSVPLRNVGAGVAFVQTVQLLTGGSDYFGRISKAVIPSRELARARFALALRDRAGQATDVNAITAQGRGFPEFTIRIVYAAASSEFATTSEITFAGLPAGDFIVTSNKVYGFDEGNRRLLASTENLE
jgi:hypothetical protein